jgi:hypothetical protein
VLATDQKAGWLLMADAGRTLAEQLGGPGPAGLGGRSLLGRAGAEYLQDLQQAGS